MANAMQVCMSMGMGLPSDPTFGGRSLRFAGVVREPQTKLCRRESTPISLAAREQRLGWCLIRRQQRQRRRRCTGSMPISTASRGASAAGCDVRSIHDGRRDRGLRLARQQIRGGRSRKETQHVGIPSIRTTSSRRSESCCTEPSALSHCGPESDDLWDLAEFSGTGLERPRSQLVP